MKVPLKSSRNGERARAIGLTLTEMVIAISVFLIAGAMTVMALRPAWQDARLASAYNDVLMMMRRARESAIVERRTYLVSFANDVKCNQLKCSEITVSRLLGGLKGAPDASATTAMQLPPEVEFLNVKGIPTSSSGPNSTPDGWGAGAAAIDFDQGVNGGNKAAIYFQPDGSARDVNNNLNNGVVYLARADDLYSSRAISLWGASGRIRGWRLYENSKSSQPHWKEQ